MNTLSDFSKLTSNAKAIRICMCRSNDPEQVHSLQTLKCLSEIDDYYGKESKSKQVFKIDTVHDILILFVAD